MNYTKLASTKRILERVAAKDGLLTWYNIVKYVSQMNDVELNPPPYYVLKELVDDGLLQLDPPEGSDSARYQITEAGRAFLAQ